MSNGNGANGRPDIGEFESELKRVNPKFDNALLPVPPYNRPLDNVAFHDFAFYEYLLPTEQGYQVASNFLLSDQGLNYIRQLEQGGGFLPSAIQWVLDQMIDIESALTQAVLQSRDPTLAGPLLEELFDSLYQAPNAGAAFLHRILSEKYGSGFDRLGGTQSQFKLIVYSAMRSVLETDILANAGRSYQWKAKFLYPFFLDDLHAAVDGLGWHPGEILHVEYPFEVFPNSSVNVGQRLIYRQEWKPLGRQVGEIVRTIPLGPGQKERVTTKIVRRRKRSSTMETVAETETTTESTSSTKDSNEIVAEAADNFNWKVDAEVHGGIDVIGGKVNTVLGGSSDEKSKQTSSSLSEAMHKAASKARRETKIVVSTESEETTEIENFSEISNPNNEMAVTYEYYRMQQQYEVFTYLAEVQSVVFVAEYLPSALEVNAGWVRRYDWIIAKVLKDESYRGILNELIQDLDEVDPVEDPSNDPFNIMLNTANEKFATFNQTSGQGNPQGQGLSLPDIYGEPQRIYQQHLRERAARKRANKLRQIKRERLFQHITDNILYYCRAVWLSEDTDQRILRYKKEHRRVPVEWQRSVQAGQGPFMFSPTDEHAPLWELIDPTGPIGYVGNYAVFALRVFPQNEPDEKGGGRTDIVIRFPDRPDTYPVDPPATFPFHPTSPDPIDLNAVLAIMRAPYFDPSTRALLDPARTAFKREAERVSAQSLSELDDEQVADLLSYVPRLGGEILDENEHVERNENDELLYQITTDDWGEYLYRKNATRRFLVDSNNLYLSLHTGEGAALEPFKRAHRYIDVLKAYEELGGLELKNQRRAAHLNVPNEYDPDVYKVIIVGDGAGSQTASHAALNDAMSATSAPAPSGTSDGASAPSGSSSTAAVGGGNSEPTGDGTL